MEQSKRELADQIYDAFEAIGFLLAPAIRGLLDGVEAFEIAAAAEATDEIAEVHETESGLKRPATKTIIGDCRGCLCDQCAKLEECVHIREGELPDGIRPFPCVGCENGMRFKPCEAERCADFEQGEGFNNG